MTIDILYSTYKIINNKKEINQFLLNAIKSSKDLLVAFNIDSTAAIINYSTSSSATSHNSNFVVGTHTELKGITISSIKS